MQKSIPSAGGMYHASLENILLEQFRWTISAANNQINWQEPDPRSHLTLEVAGAEEEEEVREDADCMLAGQRGSSRRL